MGRKRVHIPIDKRKRALLSCDRCRQRKRACKRYQQDGTKVFDSKISCESCVSSNETCTTELPRKKRSYFSVSETTLVQFKCLTLIIKAMFPESDPNNLDHIKNIANALFVTLPKYEPSEEFEELDGKNNTDDNNNCNDHLCEVLSNNEIRSDELPRKEYNRKEPDINMSGASQMGLGGADRLFSALLEVGKIESPNTGHETIILTKSKLPLSPPLLINGNNIQKSLLLNLIPPQECQMYINVFFSRLHESYFIFNESKFRKRHDIFLNTLNSENMEADDVFCNEEICTIYLVWILGRNCYLTKLLQVDDPSKANIVSNFTIEKYAEVIKICLSGCFYSNNIHCVRMLYLMSLYHSTIRNREMAWHLLSNCCLKCFVMGYNRNSSISKFSESEREDIKVVWWSSFKLHMNNCAIKGMLPNISLYEVDLDLPKLEHLNDKLFKDTYTKSIELFKIMFNILKNREYLTKSRNPWCKENLRNIMKLNTSLKVWEGSLGYSIKYYKRPNPKRYQIKLHLQYYYCSISLIAPYLIAYALNPKRSFESSNGMIDTLCDGVSCAIQLMKVISFSVNSGYCNGLLHYDLFYSYNGLMILLLGYTMINDKSKDNYSENYKKFRDKLLNNFEIGMDKILKAINEIREINNYYGAGAVGTMRDFSNNITTLLKYFKLNVDPMEYKQTVDTLTIERAQLEVFLKNPTVDYIGNDNNAGEVSEKDTKTSLETQNNDFFNFINFINTENIQEPSFFNDQLLLDWNKMFGRTNAGFCDHQF